MLRQQQRAGKLTLPEAQAILTRFLAVPISLRFPRRLYRRVLELAEQYNLPAVYDAHYLALSELLGAMFWTDDRHFCSRMKRSSSAESGRNWWTNPTREYNWA